MNQHHLREGRRMPREFIRRDVPESDVDQVVKDFEDDGCKVEKTKQTDGNWTVTATCPDK